MVLSPTSASPYFCTVACPAASASANWVSVGVVAPWGSPSRAASLFWLSSSAPEPASPALARSRKNMPNRRSEEHTSELQSRGHLVCRLLLEKKKRTIAEPTQTHGAFTVRQIERDGHCIELCGHDHLALSIDLGRQHVVVRIVEELEDASLQH